MKIKSLQFKETLLAEGKGTMEDDEYKKYQEFTASDRWISGVLRRGGFIEWNLHGEYGQVNTQKAEELMHEFRAKILKAKVDNDIPLERCFNADQTRLYYKRLPKTIYCLKEERLNLRGTKCMTDKDGVLIMTFVSPYLKGPLAMIGK